MAKKLTPEEQAALTLRLTTAEDLTPEEVKDLQAAYASSTSNEVALAEKNAELALEIEAKNAEIAELKSAQSVFTKEVEGTFKNGKKEYRFVKGHLRTRISDAKLAEKYGKIVDSKLLLTEEDLKPEMINLIKIGYAGIEEVPAE